MPFYEYRCERGHTFEVLQRMSDDPVMSCTTCGAGVQRVLHPVAVHFKGSGFYTTDYGRKKAGADGGSGDEAKKDGKKDEAKKKSDGGSDSGAKAGSGSSKSS